MPLGTILGYSITLLTMFAAKRHCAATDGDVAEENFSFLKYARHCFLVWADTYSLLFDEASMHVLCAWKRKLGKAHPNERRFTMIEVCMSSNKPVDN